MNTVNTVNARTVFDTLYTIAEQIEFNPIWNNGTGYYDEAAEAELMPCEMVRFTSPAPNNRKGIIFSTRFGNVVVFERYTNGANDIFVTNAQNGVREGVGYSTSCLSGDDILAIASATVHSDEPLPDLLLVDNIKACVRATELCEFVTVVEGGYVVRTYEDKKLYLLVKDSNVLPYVDRLDYTTRFYAVAGQKLDQSCVTEEQVIAALLGGK